MQSGLAIMTGEIVKRDERIRALERMNATLAAEIDLMAPVVGVALKVCRPTVIHASLLPLQEVVDNYKAAKRQQQRS